MPKVSIIVPNYNHGPYLKERLDSVLNQTFKDFEVILLDDASSDNSMDTLRAYAWHPKVRLVVNEQNSGNTFIQWNKGFAMAKGEYIWIAESDDRAHPELLETLVGILDKNKRVGLAYCLSAYMDASGNIFGSQARELARLDDRQWKTDFVEEGKLLLTAYMIVGNIIPNASAAVFRKLSFQCVGGARTDMKLCGDWLTWIDIMLHNHIGFVSRPLNFYRFHGSTVRKRMYYTMQFIVEYLDGIKLVDEKLGIPAASRKKALQTYRYRFFMMCLNYCKIPDMKRYFFIIRNTATVFGSFQATIFSLGGLFAMMMSAFQLPFLNRRLK